MSLFCFIIYFQLSILLVEINAFCVTWMSHMIFGCTSSEKLNKNAKNFPYMKKSLAIFYAILKRNIRITVVDKRIGQLPSITSNI